MKLLPFLPFISSSLALIPPHYTRHTQHYPYNPWPYFPTGTGTGTASGGKTITVTTTTTNTVTVTALPTGAVTFPNATLTTPIAETSTSIDLAPITLITLPSSTVTPTAGMDGNVDPSTTAVPVAGDEEEEEEEEEGDGDGDGEDGNLRPNDIPPATLIALGDGVPVEARGC